MNFNKRYAFSVLFSFLMIMSVLLINKKEKNIYNIQPPDMERLIGLHPDRWYPVSSDVSSPEWLDSAQSEYDMVKAKTYRNEAGQEVTIVMTWGRNGIQKGGHEQQLCYSAQGFSIADQKNVEVPIKSKKLIVTNFVASQLDGQVEDVYYWRITDGRILKNTINTGFDNLLLSHRILKTKEFLRYLFTNTPDNIMVRVSSRKYSSEKSSVPMKYIKEYLEKLSPKDLKLLTGL